MATINKDFKVKNGLVVEGTTGTINNHTILTEVDGDAYILDLIGGETLITSVSNEFDVTDGELSIDRETVDAYYDAAGAAGTAESNANDYTNNKVLDYTKTVDLDSTVGGYGYLKNADLPTMYTDADAVDAISAVLGDGIEYDGTFDVQVGEGLEIGGGTGNEIVINRTTVDAWYDAAGAAAAAQTAAEGFATQAIADLVDSAPATLDTLNELAAALQDNPDIISDLQDIAAGKQDTLTAGANIDITEDTISVTGLDTDDVSEGANLYFTNQRALDATASAYDASGAAATAEQNAKDYADDEINALTTDAIEEGSTNLYFTDARATFAAKELLVNADKTNISITYSDPMGPLTIVAEDGVADSTTDDLEEGEDNLYFTDDRVLDAVDDAVINPQAVEINMIARQVAAIVEDITTASTVTAYSFAKSDYRSAKFLIKTAYSTHTELTEVLLTLDSSDNIAIVEYAMVGTNGSSMTVSADIDGSNVRLRVTTLNNNSTVTVMGTLLV